MPSPRTIDQILTTARTIAVVGASSDPSKAAYTVPLTIQRLGYRVIPVNPRADVLFDEPVHRTLSSITEAVDVVVLFRPSDQTPPFAEQAVEMGAGTLWLQKGIVSSESRDIAEAAGLDYVEDRCVMVEALRLRSGEAARD